MEQYFPELKDNLTRYRCTQDSAKFPFHSPTHRGCLLEWKAPIASNFHKGKKQGYWLKKDTGNLVIQITRGYEKACVLGIQTLHKKPHRNGALLYRKVGLVI